MRTTLRPRLLGNLRELLAESERDIQALQGRLRASEELQGGALVRLETLEARFGTHDQLELPDCHDRCIHLDRRLEALERLATDQGQLHKLRDRNVEANIGFAELEHRVTELERAAVEAHSRSHGSPRNVTYEQLQDVQRSVEHMQEQLSAASASRASAIAEADRWHCEAQKWHHEAERLKNRISAMERDLAPAAREAEDLRTHLAQAASETALLRSQLAARDSDSARLECRIVELEAMMGPSKDGRRTRGCRDSRPVALEEGSTGSTGGCVHGRVLTLSQKALEENLKRSASSPLDKLPGVLENLSDSDWGLPLKASVGSDGSSISSASRRGRTEVASAPCLHSVNTGSHIANPPQCGSPMPTSQPTIALRPPESGRIVIDGSPTRPGKVNTVGVPTQQGGQHLAEPVQTPRFTSGSLEPSPRPCKGQQVAVNPPERRMSGVVLPRSQSAPVPLRRTAASPQPQPHAGVLPGSAVPLARWAASPDMGTPTPQGQMAQPYNGWAPQAMAAGRGPAGMRPLSPTPQAPLAAAWSPAYGVAANPAAGCR